MSDTIFSTFAVFVIVQTMAGACLQPAAAADNAFWVLQGGFEYDDEGGYAVNSGLSYLHSPQTYLALDLGLSNSPTGQNDLETAYASVLLDHSFGSVGGSLTAGWSSDADVMDRFRYGGSVYFHVGGFRLEVIGEQWTGDFDTFEFSRTFKRDPSLSPIVVTGTANCDLDNTTLGGHLSYSRDVWRVYASATDYDYSRADCAFTDMLGDIDLRSPPYVLADLAPAFFRSLAVAKANQIISVDAAFLDHSYSAGVSFQVGGKILALDYFHSEEVFEQFTADTLLGSVLFPVGWSADLELRVGVTDHESSGAVAFFGATVFWYIGGGN